MEFNAWIQSRLTAHGFAVGPVDGIIGPTTLAAIRAFEAAHGLPVDGTADERVVQALRASASAVPPAVMVNLPNRDKVAVTDLPKGHSAVWPRQPEVPRFYGAPGDMTNMTQVAVPFDMFLAWDKGTRVRKITVHRKVAASVISVFDRVAVLYSAGERAALGINMFGGSLNVRKMRGGNSYSMHSWGIALDFDPERNGLTTKRPQARLSSSDAIPFWQAWESEGWVSLGRERDHDWMHVQAARL